ncbi:MAG: hypothetical protein K2K70_07980 [Lachnospiraceae bacterium]|nr:hypothetical protein [Lachnospiraceae bacterium]
MSISNMIEKIRKKPGLYIGGNNITALWHFLNGYRFGQESCATKCDNVLLPLDFKFMDEFTRVQLNCRNSLGWCHNILDFCNGDEEKAIDKFFELYDEFNQIGMKGYWKAVLNEQNIRWNNSMEHGYAVIENRKEPIFKNPSVVYFVALTIPAYILVIETSERVRVDPELFSDKKVNEQLGTPFCPEAYFGKSVSWEEYTVSDNLEFEKNKTIKWYSF